MVTDWPSREELSASMQGVHGQNSSKQIRTQRFHSARTLRRRFGPRRPALGHYLGMNGRPCGRNKGLPGGISALSNATSSPIGTRVASTEQDTKQLCV